MRLVKAILVTALSFGIFFSSMPAAYADARDMEIAELKQLVRQLTKRIEKLEVSQGSIKKEARAVAVVAAKDAAQKVSGVPGWVEKIKFKGDVRLRNEYKKPGSGYYVNRQRIRARLGVEAKISDTVKAGIAMASGGTNARSTNQSLQNAFQTKEFGLDMAYVDWKASDYVRLTGGKYKNPLYHPGDLLWDSDLRFEGASTNIKYPIKGLEMPLDLMLNTGVFTLDDISSRPDSKNPYLYVIQGGVGSSYKDDLDAKLFLGYLDFSKIEGTNSSALVPNTGDAIAGDYRYDYDIIEVSGEVTSHYLEKNLEGPLSVPLTLFADYIQNISPDNDKVHGWEVGAKFGKKPKKFGDWRFVYNYRWLERNSFPDDFPDADAFGGRTDGFGNEAIFSFGLAKNIWLEFDYYFFRDKAVGTDKDHWTQLVQLDLNVKF